MAKQKNIIDTELDYWEELLSNLSKQWGFHKYALPMAIMPPVIGFPLVLIVVLAFMFEMLKWLCLLIVGGAVTWIVGVAIMLTYGSITGKFKNK